MWGMGGWPLMGLLPIVFLFGILYFFRRSLRNRDESVPHLGKSSPTVPDLFRLAKEYSGVLTVSDLVSEFSVEPEVAESLLDKVTDGRRVDMEVDENGVVRYVFRELKRLD